MKVSIIVPVYNAEKYLEECLDSICKQSFPEDGYEVILVNDGSDDRSGQICDRYAEVYNPIRVIHQKNAGVSAARNAGLANARGEWIVFVDSDDYVSADYLANFFSGDVHGVDIVLKTYCRYEEDCTQITTDLKFSQREILSPQDLIMRYPMSPYYDTPYAKLYKRKIIVQNNLKFDEKLSYGEDTLFVLNYFAQIKFVRTETISDYHYRYSPGGLSKLPQTLEKEEYLFNELKDVLKSGLGLDERTVVQRLVNNSARLLNAIYTGPNTRANLKRLHAEHPGFFPEIYKRRKGVSAILYYLLQFRLTVLANMLIRLSINEMKKNNEV